MSLGRIWRTVDTFGWNLFYQRFRIEAILRPHEKSYDRSSRTKLGQHGQILEIWKAGKQIIFKPQPETVKRWRHLTRLILWLDIYFFLQCWGFSPNVLWSQLAFHVSFLFWRNKEKNTLIYINCNPQIDNLVSVLLLSLLGSTIDLS